MLKAQADEFQELARRPDAQFGCPGSQSEGNQGRIDFGWRMESRGADIEQRSHLGVKLHLNAQRPIGAAAGPGRHPIGDLFLDQEYAA